MIIEVPNFRKPPLPKDKDFKKLMDQMDIKRDEQLHSTWYPLVCSEALHPKALPLSPPKPRETGTLKQMNLKV